ncbi:MAG: hypothetical protein KC442_05600 [Thermomicrobiales bacterium]|nr:hypothetical protein [Thermomicrobiales bacterium]
MAPPAPEASARAPAWWWENTPPWFSVEQSGGFLWASQREPGGPVATRGSLLTSLGPGDRVLRVSWDAIFRIGIVQAAAELALRPRALGGKHDHWSPYGYRVPVEFVPLIGQIEVRQIPRVWRAAMGGPFTREGGVRSSRLYPLPAPFVSWLLERFAAQIPAGVCPPEPPPDTHTAAWHELYRQTMATFYPDAATRQMCLELLADTILAAHDAAPGSWTTALPDPHHFRMNVAKIEVCVFRKDEVYLVLDKDALQPAARAALGDCASPLPESGAQYRSTPFAHGFSLPVRRLSELLPYARGAHLALVGRAARGATTRSAYANVQQPQFIDYLRVELGRELPQPDYSRREEPERDLPQPDDASLGGEWRAAWLIDVPASVGDLADLLAESRVGGGSIWPVSRYQDEMQAGQPVILWQSGFDAGIYAVGELDDAPREHTPGDCVVPVRYTALLAEPLPVAGLLARPALRELARLPEPGHTVCKVPEELWAALRPLLSRLPE